MEAATMDEKEKAPASRAADRVVKAPRKRGRPLRYSPKVLEVARKALSEGATLDEVARLVSTNVRNLYVWAARYDNFKQVLKAAGAPADDRVVLSMYQRACGYDVKTEKVYRNSDGSITRVETTEHVPADVGAAAIWLKTRRREEWGESGDGVKAGTVIINLTAEDLAGAGVKTIEHSPAETVEPVNG